MGPSDVFISYDLDLLPATLLKACLYSLLGIITNITNYHLVQINFQTIFNMHM